MPVFTKHIFHKPSDIACHKRLLTGSRAVISTDLLSKITAREAFHFDANQTGCENPLDRRAMSQGRIEAMVMAEPVRANSDDLAMSGAWSMRAMRRPATAQTRVSVELIYCGIATSETAVIGLRARRCWRVWRSQLQYRPPLCARCRRL
jgi:hypothetical protein